MKDNVIPETTKYFFEHLFRIDNNDNNDNHDMHKKRKQLVLFLSQMISFNLSNGRKKTPIKVMLAEAIHYRTRSKTLVTCFNRLGLCTSYKSLLNMHGKLARYTYSRYRQKGVVPLPSHLHKSSYTVAAFDNFNHIIETLSGIEVTNDTVSVLFQTTGIEHVKQKPEISEVNLETEACKNLLSCQIIDPTYCKPALKPTIRNSYPHINMKILGSTKPENYSEDYTACSNPEQQEDYVERQTSFPSYLNYTSVCNEGRYTFIRKNGFLPVLPYPATDYATIYQSLVNFNHVLNNLDRERLPVFADEKVYANSMRNPISKAK